MKIDQTALAVLSALEYPRETHAKITEQLDRKTYTAVNNVLTALGGKWSRKDAAHVFGSDARVRIDHAITTGEVETGQDVGWFPTPPTLAAHLVKMADVRRGMLALEPSAGEGAIVKALLEAGAHITTCERDANRRGVLKALRTDDDRLYVSLHDDFLDTDRGRFVGPSGFDRVVMNPPFCKVGKGDHLDHFLHAFGLLSREGVIVSVMPSSVKFRRDRRYREFREFVDEHNGTIEDLPTGSFKSSGTGVNTVTVTINQEHV